MSVKKFGALLVILVAALVLVFSVGMADTELEPIEELGEFLYFDKDLSLPSGQACADCHHPEAGFVDPDSDIPVSQGVLPKNRFGNRNSPAAAYAMYAPIRYFDEDEKLWIGGQFWDSRATGEVLGDPLADQALGPFLNLLEMNNPNKLTVIQSIKLSDYAVLFEEVWGEGSLDDVEAAYDQVALSIAAFERTEDFGQFSSKYDDYLQLCLVEGGTKDDCAQGMGDAALTASAIFITEEWKGFQLFMGEENDNDGVLDPGEGAMCVLCHVADWTTAADYAPDVVVPDWAPTGWVPPLFTDFTYDNLGVPKNPDNPFYHLPHAFNPDGDDFVDYGLGPVVNDPKENGKFKVMTLRNIGLTEPYSHNGFFLTLDEITNFYNTRDVVEEGWPAPEVLNEINTDELGNLGLSSEDEAALVWFMKTLSDGWEEE